MKITAKPLAILVLIILFGTISVSSVMGLWRTETTKVPVTYSSGDFAGQYNPADIRGSYTFGDVSSLFDVSLEDLRIGFNFPADQELAEVKIKDLEALYAESEVEVGTESVRVFVALYRGLPITLSEDTYFPAVAVAILKQRAPLSLEQIAFLDSHTLSGEPVVSGDEGEPAAASEDEAPVPVVQAEEVVVEITLESTEHTPPDRMVRGKTTFGEVLDWGVSQDRIEQVLGIEMGARIETIKDFCSNQELEFSTIKTALQAEVDAIP